MVRKSSIFWDITPCSPLKANRCFGGTHRLHHQRWSISWARNKQDLATCFQAGFLLSLFFRPEYEGDMLLRNVCWLSVDYTALYPGSWNSFVLLFVATWSDRLSVLMCYLGIYLFVPKKVQDGDISHFRIQRRRIVAGNIMKCLLNIKDKIRITRTTRMWREGKSERVVNLDTGMVTNRKEQSLA
jgi:hypothetical protein